MCFVKLPFEETECSVWTLTTLVVTVGLVAALVPTKKRKGQRLVDSDIQNELMEMDPFDRLSAIEELIQTGCRCQAAGR
jgi:hypothetical protein